MATNDTPTTGSTRGFLGTDPEVFERTESTYDLYNPGDSQRIDENGALRFRCDADDRQQFRELEGEDL